MTPGMCRPQPHHVVLSKKKFVSMGFVDMFGRGMLRERRYVCMDGCMGSMDLYGGV
jgi:hypothetical protein